jgi:hypothetical protein
VNKLNHKNLKRRKKKIEKRLERRNWEDQSRPMFQGSNIHYEVDGRNKGMAQGGIGVMHRLTQKIGLTKAIDQELHLLKRHLPYYESDHVLNLCYNLLSGGSCLEDIELRRRDEAYMNALGAKIIPDPTTAGDFLRRFTEEDILTLMNLINHRRLKVWEQQPKSFFKEGVLNVDGTIAPTEGECKQGMDISYKGDWGYHPLVISLAQTREALYLINRPGNVPSHQDAAEWIDRSLDLVCDRFKTVWLRGDTDFSLTDHLDRWAKRCHFVFGVNAYSNLVAIAASLPETHWNDLPPKSALEKPRVPRQRPENVKERIVKERGYKNIRTVSEQVAQFTYRPGKCKNAYRLVVIRKNLSVERGEQVLFDDLRYFFYITNDWDLSAREVVYFIRERCDHENDLDQLKNGVKAMTWPVHDLVSNWAYLVIAALAWNLKAWLGLLTPRTSLRHHILRMEFKRFIHMFILIPCLIIRTGRRIVYRLLGYNEQMKDFLKTDETLRLLRLTG